jgi:uncharacterized membrane protein YkvA (DUF1232 family)
LLPASSIKAWASKLKQDLLALWIAAGCARTPLSAKLIAFIVAGYAFSPIDLIPDFIPILGFVDDVILLPLGIILAIALIPTLLMQRFRDIARHRSRRPQSPIAAIVIVLIWAAGLIWGAIALRAYMIPNSRG